MIFPSSTHFSWPRLDNTEGPRSPKVRFFNHTGCTEFLYWMKLAGFYWLRIIHSILRKFTPKFLLTKLHEWFSLTSKVRAMMLTWTFVNNRIYKDILYLCSWIISNGTWINPFFILGLKIWERISILVVWCSW